MHDEQEDAYTPADVDIKSGAQRNDTYKQISTLTSNEIQANEQQDVEIQDVDQDYQADHDFYQKKLFESKFHNKWKLDTDNIQELDEECSFMP